MEPIRIEHIPVTELFEFAQAALADKARYPILPISPQRALAQSLNPLAEENDTGLIAAYHEGKCAGYLGIIPCMLLREGSLHKIHALSAFYVDEPYRKMKAAVEIMSAAIDIKKDFLLAGFTPEAERFYVKNPQWFQRTVPLKYCRVRLRPLKAAINKLKKMLPMFTTGRSEEKSCFRAEVPGIGYYLLKPSGYSSDKRLGALIAPEISLYWNDKIPPADEQRMYFYRGPEIVNWMIKYPWISEDMNTELNYHFSYKERLFRYTAYELFDNHSQKAVGYTVFCVKTAGNSKILKILDTLVGDEADISFVFNLALAEAFRWKADYLEASGKFLPCINTNPVLKAMTQIQERGNFLHPAPENSAFSNHLKMLETDVCDGDQAFF